VNLVDEKPAPSEKSRFGGVATGPGSKPWLEPIILIACCGFLYLETFSLPDIPRVAIGDQSIYLHNAARMLEGQIIYRDYDYFTLPGTDVLYAILFRLFGIRAWIPQAMLVLVGVITTWLSIGISRKLMKGWAVFLPGFVFLALPFSSYLDATHHWYSTLCAVAALAVVIEERTPGRLMWAGLLWGLATCFAQSLALGPMGLGLFLVWEHRRKEETRGLLLKKESCLFASYVATVAAFSAYFVWKAGPRRFLSYTVVFIAKYYSTYPANNWKAYMAGRPSVHVWANWPDLVAWPLIHLLIPLVYLLFFVRYWREARFWPQKPWERLMLVNITGLCLFLAVASGPAWNRLYTVSLPALIILVWFLNSPLKLEKNLLRGLWAIVMVLAVVRPIVTQVHWRAYLNLPTGRTSFLDPTLYLQAKWLDQRTQPYDYFFGDQLLCFALRLRAPSRIAFATPFDFTRPDEVQDLIRGLEEHQVRFVSWYNGLDPPVDNARDNLAPLRRYLRNHYRVAQTFSSGDIIWERNQ